LRESIASGDADLTNIAEVLNLEDLVAEAERQFALILDIF
jgi:hypothetical protein